MITDFAIANELAKLAKVSEDKADLVLNGFKSGAGLSAMREFWHARTARSKARVVKKYWL